jgi:hypothetical protein
MFVQKALVILSSSSTMYTYRNPPCKKMLLQPSLAKDGQPSVSGIKLKVFTITL